MDQACVLLKASLSQVRLTYLSAHLISPSITSLSSDAVVSQAKVMQGFQGPAPGGLRGREEAGRVPRHVCVL